jgi:hypothetical protein
MYDILMFCSFEHTTPLVNAIKKWLQGLGDVGEILTYGMTYKQGRGFILLTWKGKVPEVLIKHMIFNNFILDFIVYEPAGEVEPPKK